MEAVAFTKSRIWASGCQFETSDSLIDVHRLIQIQEPREVGAYVRDGIQANPDVTLLLGRLVLSDAPSLSLAEALLETVNLLAGLIPGNEWRERARSDVDDRSGTPRAEPVEDDDLPTGRRKEDDVDGLVGLVRDPDVGPGVAGTPGAPQDNRDCSNASDQIELS